MDERARAIEQVYRTRYASFRNAVAALAGSPQVAHDAVQEAFAEALAQRAHFRGGSWEAWIWTVALRTAARMTGKDASSGRWMLAEQVVPEGDPELLDAIRQLAPRRRLMVFLRYYADLSYAEIAEACGVSPGTVAATFAQARGELEAMLKEAVR